MANLDFTPEGYQLQLDEKSQRLIDMMAPYSAPELEVFTLQQKTLSHACRIPSLARGRGHVLHHVQSRDS